MRKGVDQQKTRINCTRWRQLRPIAVFPFIAPPFIDLRSASGGSGTFFPAGKSFLVELEEDAFAPHFYGGQPIQRRCRELCHIGRSVAGRLDASKACQSADFTQPRHFDQS